MAQLVLRTLTVSIFLTVFALGLQTTLGDVLAIGRQPALLVRSFIAMNVVMPVLAVLLAALANVEPSVEFALLVLAVSPVPPFLPGKGAQAGARNSYMYGLLVSAALLSVIVTPLAVEVMARFFGTTRHVSPIAIGLVIAKTILLPISLGLVVHARWPAFAQRVAAPIGAVTKIVLLLIMMLLLVAAREAVGDIIGNGTILAIVAFILAGLAVGHLLGGPDEHDRTFLAFATSSRHPGVALTVASAAAAEPKLVLAAVLVYLVVNLAVGAPYARWRKRSLPMSSQPLPHPSR